MSKRKELKVKLLINWCKIGKVHRVQYYLNNARMILQNFAMRRITLYSDTKDHDIFECCVFKVFLGNEFFPLCFQVVTFKNIMVLIA